MKSISHLPPDEQLHFAQCDACGDYFDMRDLSDVFSHEHGKDMPKVNYTSSKRVGDSTEWTKDKQPIQLN